MGSIGKISFQTVKGAGNGAFFVMYGDWTSLIGVPRIDWIMGYFWRAAALNHG
jgi:hypothetical protein